MNRAEREALAGEITQFAALRRERLEAEVAGLRAAVSRVQTLHLRCECDGDAAGHCDNDAEPWPCATRRALEADGG